MQLTPENVVIVITSDEDLSTYGYTPLHYMEALAESYEVLFVGPSMPWNWRNLLLKPVIGLHGKVKTFQYLNVIPLRILPFFSLLLNDFINVRTIRKHLKKGKKVVWWKFDFAKMVYTNTSKEDMIIYHVRDPYMGRRTDRLHAKKADLIVTVKKDFMAYYFQLNDHVIFIAHGINIRDTIADYSRKQQLRNEMGPYLLMAGSINNDLDFSLLIKIARFFTNQTLLLLGNNCLTDATQQQLFKELCSMKNVRHPGSVQYDDLKNYVAAASACLVTYNTGKKGFHRNPIKITNYIALQRPVVNTVEIVELAELESKIVFSAHDHDTFIRKLEMLLNGELQVDKEFVKSYIQNHTYQKLYDQILNQLELVRNED